MNARLARLLSLMVVAFSIVFVAAACGSDDDPASTTTGATRDYRDVRGVVVKIPQNPTRVVTLGEGVLDSALALDVTPVGTVSARGQSGTPAYLGAKAAQVPIVASSQTPNLQQILKVHPDLILVDDTTGARNKLGELSKIAPTVLVARYADGWETFFDSMSKALNRPEQHRQVVADIDTRIADIHRQIAADNPSGKPLTASVVRWAADGPTIVGGNSISSWVLGKVGMTRPAAQEKINSHNRSGEKVSLENLDLIDADYIFFGALAGKQKATEELAAAQKLPGFSTLNAARGGHVIPVDGVPWTSGSGPLGVEAILSDIDGAFPPA